MAERIFPEGWWALSGSAGLEGHKPAALVASDADNEPKPEAAETPALALVAATLATLYRRSK
ncbi:hypothetical protein [Methylobrevis pamukkalensis]|nr:hypothetical protein [Methylobrevis pamukkalensis]